MWSAATWPIPTATMEMQVGKDVVREAGFGNGPVDRDFRGNS